RESKNTAAARLEIKIAPCLYPAIRRDIFTCLDPDQQFIGDCGHADLGGSRFDIAILSGLWM
ncbi:MAG TPA: hypothetical protein PL166_02620, partial [Candidatus Contendobacter sp.]|nr:hypothetical protein [Candidatus Contendobacter sp.]